MKILFQIQGPGTAAYTGVGSALAKMWREEGWRGLLRGNGTNCVRIVPYSACQFAAYTTYKRVVTLPPFSPIPQNDRLRDGFWGLLLRQIDGSG
jgi:solute carrier family 25 (mitochondrial phosphate transporter), member 23/24/25/41